MIKFQPARVGAIGFDARELHRYGIARFQPLDLADVQQQIAGRKSGLIGDGKGTPVTLDGRGCRISRHGGRDGLDEPVVPTAHDLDDVGLERCNIGLRDLARPSVDDEMHPDQRAFSEVRRERRHLAAESFRQLFTDLLAHVGVEAVARNEDKGGDETVKAVSAHEDAGARPFLKLQDPTRHIAQTLGLNLEQLITRKMLEYIEQPLAGMTAGAEAARCQDAGDLAADERYLTRRTGIGAGGEQAHQAQFAAQLAGGIELLDADIVHSHPAVHIGAGIGLGDDEGCRLQQKGPDFRCHRYHGLAAAQDMAVGIAQNAEAGLIERL